MQCKDIPDLPILEFLDGDLGSIDLGNYIAKHNSANWFGDKFENSVTHAMPKGIASKLVLAKMRVLIKRGFVDGCDCGCRGDFRLTEKGRCYLMSIRIA